MDWAKIGIFAHGKAAVSEMGYAITTGSELTKHADERGSDPRHQRCSVALLSFASFFGISGAVKSGIGSPQM